SASVRYRTQHTAFGRSCVGVCAHVPHPAIPEDAGRSLPWVPVHARGPQRRGAGAMGGQPEGIPEPRRALGLVLAKFREGSNLNQTDLGRLTHYSRTTISHIEAGRQFPEREFWEIADSAYGAHGALVAQYDEVCEDDDHQRIGAIETARAERRDRARKH